MTQVVHRYQRTAPTTPAIAKPDTVSNSQCLPIQKIVCASLPCQLFPFTTLKKLHAKPLYSSGMRILTCSSRGLTILRYSIQITERNRGPVEYMTVIYGMPQLRLYDERESIVFKKKGCWGTEPMASFEIPVGTVLRTQAGYERRGSRRLLQPSSRSM